MTGEKKIKINVSRKKELKRFCTYNLLFRVLIGRQQIDCLHVAEVDVMTQQKNEQQFAHVFLLLITIQCLVAFEFTTNICQLLIDSLDFGLFTFT